nr:hypothetical protein [Tanacetum cinerariifolium]
MIRGSKTVSDTVLKHDLCELVIAEVCFAITNDGTGVPNLAKRDFKNLQTTRASLVGSAFAWTNFDKHFITLQNLSLTLTSVIRFDQVMGITVDCGSIESEVKHLLGDVVQAMISPGMSIVANLENVNGFLAMNTPPDDLIRTDFEQEGVVLKVMHYIFEDFVLLLGRHSLNNEIPRMEENLSKQSRLRIFLSKEIFEGGVIPIHNAFVHDAKTGHRPGYLRKVLYESSIEAGMTKNDTNTLDGGRMRKLSDYIKFSLIQLNPVLGNLMAEDDALFDHEVTLLPI